MTQKFLRRFEVYSSYSKIGRKRVTEVIGSRLWMVTACCNAPDAAVIVTFAALGPTWEAQPPKEISRPAKRQRLTKRPSLLHTGSEPSAFPVKPQTSDADQGRFRNFPCSSSLNACRSCS
jgi:hypothetical protein